MTFLNKLLPLPPLEYELFTNVNFPKPAYDLYSQLKTDVTELVTEAFINEFEQKPLTHLNAFHKYAITNKYQSILNTINHYKSLENGWDGDHSISPSGATIEHALSLIKHLPPGIPYPNPMLNPTGEVGFFWNNESGYIDIEVEPEGQITVYTREKTGALTESFHEFDIHRIENGPDNSPVVPLLNLIK